MTAKARNRAVEQLASIPDTASMLGSIHSFSPCQSLERNADSVQRSTAARHSVLCPNGLGGTPFQRIIIIEHAITATARYGYRYKAVFTIAPIIAAETR
jgi:hypothetical protein